MFNWLQSTQQSALLRRVVDRIRNSLELKVVLQTAVEEVALLLDAEAIPSPLSLGLSDPTVL